MSVVAREMTPSTWFVRNAGLMRPGAKVLDIACGRGRHAIAAAERGADVVAVDSDARRLQEAENVARRHNVSVRWVHADLEREPLPPGDFDVVMVFYYLDRRRMHDFLAAVKPGGHVLAETYLEGQRELGVGPTRDAHLLKAGELPELVRPFEVVLAREVLEEFNGRSKVIASVLAERLPE